ncbi:MAG: phospholipase D-like domain-containing protein [Candidatus Tyrphobacter sp.]
MWLWRIWTLLSGLHIVVKIELAVLYGVLGQIERTRSALDELRATFPTAEVLQWPTIHGFLHAKMIAIDDDIVYCGSANVTEYGWQRNVEVGITMSGPVALPLVQYCEGLIRIARDASERSGPRALLEGLQL